MRTAYNSEFITDEKQHLIGIFTGADFCAEHEWGIKRLRQSLGMKDAIGVEGRTNTNGIQSAHLAVVSSKHGPWVASLLLGEAVQYLKTTTNRLDPLALAKKYDLHDQGRKLYCEWDESSVRIVVCGQAAVTLLSNIFQAFEANRGYLAFGAGKGLLGNAGLVIMDVKNISAKNRELIELSDTNRIKLKLAAQATGIEQKLKATQTDSWHYPQSGCKWYALSPRWADTKELTRTKHPVVFWLNPQSQDKINHGWFTVEELELWIKGEGPCVKTTPNKPISTMESLDLE